jgi:uncharacterized membrane protein
MRTILIFLVLSGVILSCANDNGSGKRTSRADKVLKEKTFVIAENYARGQLSSANRSVAGNGSVTLSDQQRKIIIEPGKIHTGLVDDDDSVDAIVTLTSFRGNVLDVIEHLIIINTDGKLMLVRSVESDMNILRISNRIITAEIHTKPRTSPLYNCESCKEIVNYRYEKGELVKKEN